MWKSWRSHGARRGDPARARARHGAAACTGHGATQRDKRGRPGTHHVDRVVWLSERHRSGRTTLAIRCVLSVVWDFLLKLCFTHFTHCAQPLRAPNPTQAAFSQRDREPQQICVRWCAECVVRLSYYDEHPMTRRRRGGPLVFASAVCLVSRAACSFFVKGELVCLSELQECHEECLRTCQFDEYRNTPLPVSLCRDTNTNPAP